MKISCPNCPAAYELEEGRIPPAGLSIKCPKCKVPFVVHKPKPGEAATTSKVAGAVPLPGTGAVPKKPAPRPGAAAPQARAGDAAVPLPGHAGAQAAQPQAQQAPIGQAGQQGEGAVPLPGSAGSRENAAGAAQQGQSRAAARPAAESSGQGAVPLPGTRSAPPPLLDGPMPESTMIDYPALKLNQAQQREGAVPLPGQSNQNAPGASEDAVPLPGLDGGGARPPAPRAAAPATPARAPGRPPDGHDPFADIDVNVGEAASDTVTDQAPISFPQGGAQPPSGPALVADFDDPFPMEPPPKPAPPGPTANIASDDPFSVDLPDAPPPAPRPPPAVLPDDGGISFDFVEAPASAPKSPQPPPPPPRSAPPPGGSSPEMLDFVDEPTAVTPKAKPTRPPPPMMGRAGDSAPPRSAPPPAGSDSLELDAPSHEGLDAGGEGGSDSKRDEKERRKRERAEKAGFDREERERRKAERKAQAGPPLSERLVPLLRESSERLKQPAVAGGLVAALAVLLILFFGVRAKRTPAGLFWMNNIIPSKKEASATEAKVIEQGMERLADGSFAGAREAAGMAARLIATLPDDEEVKAFYVLCASELKVAYGQTGGDWDQAKRVVERIKTNGVSQLRARGAFALGSADLPKARSILMALGDKPGADLESVYLYSQALISSNEQVHAAQVLDNALGGLKNKATDPTKLLLLRGQVARSKGQLPEAAGFYDQALTRSPGSGRALIEMADVKLRQGNLDQASGLLDKALGPDIRKSLDATEEARASMLRGRLFAARHQGKDAEQAFERSIALDPASPEIREASGNFRLARREYHEAAKQFDSALSSGANTPGVLAGAARAYLGTNRLLEADKRINEAAGKDSANADYIYLQGKVAEAIGKGDEAYKDYDRALAKKADLAEALTAQGAMLLARGDREGAQARLDAAAKVPEASKTSAEQESIGELALALGHADQAKEAYARALVLDPEDPQAHSGMGKTLAVLNDLPAARKEFELGLAELDSDPNLLFEYGSLQRRLGDADGALASLQKAVKLESKDPRYRSRLGAVLVEKGEFEKAEEQLHQATLMNDKYGEAQYFLARAMAGQKKLSEAVDVMKKAVELEPDNAEYLYRLGLIYEDGQQVQDAIDAFQRSIAKNEKSPDTYEHLGKNLTIENRFQDAVESFKKAAALDPKRARLWAEVGDSEQQAGDVDAAIGHFQKAVAQDPNLPGAWAKLGIAYKDKGCADCKRKALDALKRAETLDPNDSVAHHELGYMYKDDGRRSEAIAEFKKYLQLAPTAGDAETVKDDIYYLQEESRRAP